MTEKPSDNSSANKPEDTSTGAQRARSEAWDRVGDYLAAVGEVGTNLARRNLDLWKDVASDLKTSPYTADTMSVTTARMMQAAIANVEDLWSAATRLPGSQSTARVLPTAVMVFGWVDGDSSPSVPLDVQVAVPREHSNLPPRAEISLVKTSGSSSAAKDAAAVATHLHAERKGGGYVVTATGAAKGELSSGTYQGTVFLNSPALALATLVVVVEAKP